jgi:hypothetical protein
MKKKIATLCLIAAVGGTSTLLWAAAVPANKATIQIDHLPGKKGAVAFPHAKHAADFKKQGGAPIQCKDCHHTEKTDTPDPKAVKACATCHLVEGQPKDVDGKKAPLMGEKIAGKDEYKIPTVLFHKLCQNCHQKTKVEGKNLGACTTCHPAKK